MRSLAVMCSLETAIDDVEVVLRFSAAWQRKIFGHYQEQVMCSARHSELLRGYVYLISGKVGLKDVSRVSKTTKDIHTCGLRINSRGQHTPEFRPQ